MPDEILQNLELIIQILEIIGAAVLVLGGSWMMAQISTHFEELLQLANEKNRLATVLRDQGVHDVASAHHAQQLLRFILGHHGDAIIGLGLKQPGTIKGSVVGFGLHLFTDDPAVIDQGCKS